MSTKQDRIKRLRAKLAVLEGADQSVWAEVSRYNGAIEEYRSKYGSGSKPKRYTLYRFRDDEDNLLYVGMTRTFINRMKSHGMDKDWWEEVSYITVEHYESAEELREAELLAISTENPRYNKADLPTHQSSSTST